MIRQNIHRTFFAAALVAATLPTGLVADDSAEFHLKIDPIVIEGLVFDQDTDSSRFQEYRDLSAGFRLTHLSLSGITSDSKRQIDFQVVNGGKQDAFYGLSYDVAGSWGLELSYDNIPHRFGNNGKMLWTRTAPNMYELQDPVQGALQGAIEAQAATNARGIDFNFLNGLIQPYLAVANEIDIGLQRRRTHAALDFGRGGAVNWKLDYQHESRDGTRALGTSFGFNNVTELPEPVSYETEDITLSGDWRFTGGFVSAGYKYSRFDNEISTLYWDNPWRATDASDSRAYSAPGSGSIGGGSRGFYDLAPDNEAGSFFANGRFDLGDNGWLQAAVNWTSYKQNDALLPYTLNSAISTPVQPHARANRKAEMMRATFDYGRRFGGGWQLGLRYAYQDYDDTSERLEFESYVRFHAVLEEIPRITTAYDWTRETVSASLDKDVANGSLSLEARSDKYDRSFRETGETTENTLGLKWRGRAGPVYMRAGYERGNRDFSGQYETEAQEVTFQHPEGINNQPGLRKYDQANRKIDRWVLSGDLPFADVWSLAFHVNGLEFDYDESEFGLTGDDTIRYGFDLSRSMGAGVFTLFAERADRDVSMAARQSGGTLSTSAADSWFADFSEVNDTWGASYTRKAENWQLRLLAERIESDGDADMFSPPGGSPDAAVGFGNYEDYERTMLQGTFDHDITSSLAVGLNVLYEEYTIDSFIRQDLANYLPGALLLNANDGDYAAWSAGLRLKVRM